MPGFWGDVAETWLGENPQAAYMGALQGWGTRPQRRRLQDQFPDIYGDFAAGMYQQMLGGNVPEDDWLTQMQDPQRSQDIFSRRWGQMTPYEKYGSQGRFSPSLRYYF